MITLSARLRADFYATELHAMVEIVRFIKPQRCC
jgi:hypothetical protein